MMNKKFQSLALWVLMFVGVIVSAIPQEAGAQQNRWMRITNYSSYTILNFYATNTGDTDWGRDRFGEGVTLGVNNYIDLNISDGSNACMFDLRATFYDRERRSRSVTEMRVNVCRANGWDIYNGYGVVKFP